MAKFNSQEKPLENEGNFKTTSLDLPDGWLMLRLENVCKLKNGYAFKSNDYTKVGGVPVIRISDIGDGQVKTQNCVRVLEKQEYNSYFIEKGEILVAMSGATTGKFGIFKSDERVYQNQRVGKFQPLNDHLLNNSFLYYLLHSLKRQILRDAYGGAQPNISSKKIEELLIPLPPPAEQKRIVAKIEELFSRLDAGVDSLKKAQAQLKTYRQAVLKWAFEGRLTNEGGNSKLPAGWKLAKIEDCAAVGTGATPLKSNKEYYENGTIPWVTSGALNDEFVREATDYVTAKAVKETNLTLYPKHTLLLAMYGEGKTRGKCSELLIEACTNQAIAAINLEGHEPNIKPFLKYFLLYNYNNVRNLAAGGVQPNLNLGIVRKTLFPLPPTPYQRQLVVAEIEKRLSVCDKLEDSIALGLQQAEVLRQSILKKAFEGKLVPQNPHDEPASVLLERISSEREKPAATAAKNSTIASKKKKSCTTQ